MATVGLDKKLYSAVQSWSDFFEKNKTIDDILYDPSWTKLFAELKNDPQFPSLQTTLKNVVTRNPSIKIYPHPEYVFKAFSVTSANDISVVFIGQDPYFNCEYYGNKYVPQAMGLSFSVPHDIKIPSSLNNIYENLIKYGHYKTKPTSGNLWFWAAQGCLMLNAALTVEDGQKLSHSAIWEWFTDHIIQFISANFSKIIFVLWGKDAHSKINNIDTNKHYTIVSSHPSGLSANAPYKSFPAFANFDHFGEINKILTKNGKKPIIW